MKFLDRHFCFSPLYINNFFRRCNLTIKKAIGNNNYSKSKNRWYARKKSIGWSYTRNAVCKVIRQVALKRKWTL